MAVCLISFAGLAVSLYLCWRARAEHLAGGARPSRYAWAWAGFYMALQAFLGVYGALGLVLDGPVAPAVLAVVLCACVWVSLNRERAFAAIGRLTAPGGRFPHPAVASAILVCVGAVFGMLALEFPSNHDFSWVYPLCFLLEWALIAAAMCGAYYLFQRRGVAGAVLVIVLYVIGLAEYFVITFKSMPITPGDLSALSTAAAVSGGYTYSLTAWCVYGMAFTAAGALCCELASAFRPAKPERTRKKLLINLLVGALCIAGIAGHVTIFDYYNTLNITVYTWRPLESYYRQGFLPTFITQVQTFKPEQPDDYSVEGAEELLAAYAELYDEEHADDEDLAAAQAQFEEESPTIIVIMNETFCDLSIYDGLQVDYEGPTYVNSLSDALQAGTLYVSAYGGGTANSEFEFLTGSTMAFLGSGVYPYTTYDLTETESLVSIFSELGYTCTALHPNHGTNWNRENVYTDLGFDEFLTIEDFEDAETLRGLVTDKATYDKILELLAEDDGPQFIFDVTMQNHSGYNTGLIADEDMIDLGVDLDGDGVSDSALNEFVTLIEESDEAIEYFLEELEKLDRKVVVVFFGDHQPYFSDDYNDAWFTDEDDATHSERQYETEYFIWANYDVAGSDQSSEQEAVSVNYLGAVLCELIGAPLTDYQKALLVIKEDLPVINSTGYATSSLAFYLSTAKVDEETASSALASALAAKDDLQTLQYYQLFGDGTDIYTLHFQDAANETDPNLEPGTTTIK